MLQKTATHAAFKFVTFAGDKFPIFENVLRAIGEFEGAVDAMPGFVNLMGHKLISKRLIGSEIIAEEFAETMVRVAEGVADAIRAAKGTELQKVTGKAAEIAKAAADKVATVVFYVDAAGYGHRASCACAKGLEKKLSYAEAAEARLKLANCCAREFLKEDSVRVLKAQQRDKEPLEVLGDMEQAVAADFLRWIRTLPTPMDQSIGMHALVDLTSNGEIRGFMRLNDEERFRHLPMLKQKIEKRLGAMEKVEAFARRLETLDESFAHVAKQRRQMAAFSWQKLDEPVPFSILGMLGF
jgi:hypothetical protein